MKGSFDVTKPKSLKTLWKNLAYNKCITACSTPPIYWFTGAHLSTIFLSKGKFIFLGSQYLKKYQDESTNVSIVSVSLLAFPWQQGQVASLNCLDVSRGFPLPENSISSGNITGRFSSFSKTSPHFSQYKTGIGVPQYLCLEIPQSFNLYL